MKKLIVTLAVLAIAMPSMAVTTLTESHTGMTATIGYSYDGEANKRPRAFALRIETSAGTISTVTALKPLVSGQKVGLSTAASPGYGIYPGTIAIDANGTVKDFNTPVEKAVLRGLPSPQAGGTGLNTNAVVVALASLYVKKTGDGDVNVPPNSGNLLTVTVAGVTSATLTITPEVTARGGVVAEDSSTLAVTPNPLTINLVSGPPIPGIPTGLSVTKGTSATQKTLTWTAGSNATSYTIKYNSKNDLASAVQLVAGITGTSYNHVTSHGETTWYWVCSVNTSGSSAYSTPDSGYLTECYPNTVPAKKTRWITYGRPDCWCYARNCKGDGDGASQGKSPNGPYWVSTNDLNILKSGWQKLDPAVGANNICADFDRTSQGKAPAGPYAVSTNDLNVLKSNWNIVNGPAAGCEAAKSVATASGPMP